MEYWPPARRASGSERVLEGKNGVLEYWSKGRLECWSDKEWSAGVLECWSDGSRKRFIKDYCFFILNLVYHIKMKLVGNRHFFKRSKKFHKRIL